MCSKIPLYEFETKVWTINANYKTIVKVFADSVVIYRYGRTGGLPIEFTVFFQEVSAVLYETAGRRAWIRFVVPNIVTAVTPKLYAFDNAKLPHIDPHTVVFSHKQKDKAKEHYQRIRELFDAYKTQ